MQWLESDFADSCDFELIGIGSHLGPHRLCWELNGSLNWNLKYFTMLEIPQRQGQTEHVVYRYSDSITLSVALVANRIPGGVIARFQGAAHFDYLLQVGEGDVSADEWLTSIRKMKDVTYVQKFDPLHSGAMEHLALGDLAETSSPELV